MNIKSINKSASPFSFEPMVSVVAAPLTAYE